MTTRAQRRAHLQKLTELSPCQASQKAFWDYIAKANDPEKGITYPRLAQFLTECKFVTSRYHEPVVQYKEAANFTLHHDKNSPFEPISITGDFTVPFNSIKAAQALEKTLITHYDPVREPYSVDEEREEFRKARQMQREGTYGTTNQDLKRKNSRTNYTYCRL